MLQIPNYLSTFAYKSMVMKNHKIVFILCILVSSVFFEACGKRGCTDKNATNYDEEAEKNIDNCMYEGRVVFWFDQSVSTKLLNYEVFNLIYFLNNRRVGGSTSGQFGGSYAECGMSGLVTARYNLEKRKSREFDYVVKDQNDKIWWQGKITLEANVCKKIQLELD